MTATDVAPSRFEEARAQALEPLTVRTEHDQSGGALDGVVEKAPDTDPRKSHADPKVRAEAIAS